MFRRCTDLKTGKNYDQSSLLPSPRVIILYATKHCSSSDVLNLLNNARRLVISVLNDKLSVVSLIMSYTFFLVLLSLAALTASISGSNCHWF